MIIDKPLQLLKNFFTESNLEKIARDTSFIKRRRKIAPSSFFEAVLFGVSKKDYCSLDFLRSIFSDKAILLAKSSLHEKITSNKSVDFMRKILEKLCAEFALPTSDYIEAKGKFSGIKVLDSTEIKLNNKLEIFKNKQNGPRCKLQTFLELHTNTVTYKITKGNENDQGYKEYLDNVDKGNLVLFDLGYFCLERFKKIAAQGAKFISRLITNVAVMNLDEKQICMNSLLKNSNGQIDMPVLIGKEEKLRCRLVAKRLTGKALRNRKAKLQRAAKRKGSSSKKLAELDLWSIYITNLEEETPAKIHTLYVLRWQIELFFKVLKSKLSLGYVEHANEYMAMIVIYAKLIAITIMMILTASISEVEISLYKAIEYFKDMIKELYGAIMNCVMKKYEAFLVKIRRFAKKEQTKKRPSSLTKAGFGKSKPSLLIFGCLLNKSKLNC